MPAIDLSQILGGYNPSDYGYQRGDLGWYRGMGENGPSSANPYGSGSSFEDYLAKNGIGMWDPGNDSYGRVGLTNQQAFSGLYPGAQTLGVGSQFGSDKYGAQTQFFTTPHGATPDNSFFQQHISGRDMGSHSGLDNWIAPIGLGAVSLLTGGAASGLLGGAGEGLGGMNFLDANDLAMGGGGNAGWFGSGGYNSFGLGEGTLGGGMGGAGLGGASLAGQGLTTADGVGSSFAGGGDLFGQGGQSLAGQQNILQQLQQMGVSPQQATQIARQLMSQGGGQAGGQQGGAGGGGGFNPLGLLGVGSGLNTMFGGGGQAVDPNRINALWQAGQNTYNTSLDPQQALYDQTAQRTQDQSRAADSARGIGMGGFSAGNENDAMRKFNIDWQNNQLGRQVQGTQAFSQAGNTAANAGIANNAQAFMQNQTGLNNLTTGLGQLFGGGGTQGAAGGNAVGSWLNGLFSGGGTAGGAAGGGMTGGGGGAYNPFPTLDQGGMNTGGQSLGGGVGGLGLGGASAGNNQSWMLPETGGGNMWNDFSGGFQF